MAKTIRTESVVRLHTDSGGLVWFGNDATPAENTRLDPWDFFESEEYLEGLDEADAVRLLGTKDNAPLVVRLHERRMTRPQFKAASVVLGSPGAVPSAWLRYDPVAVMHHLWQPEPSAAPAAHWHDMRPTDYATYAMLNVVSDRGPVPEYARRTAEYHPAWPAVTFINSADLDAACTLLCHIVDPRWFRHHVRPTRLSRLFAHLGLTPANMAVIAGDSAAQGRHFNRAATAVRVWYNQRVSRGSKAPGDFLLKSLAGRTLADGLLHGTRRMVSLLTWFWLHAVQTTTHPDGGFCPSRFFRDVAVGEAFTNHAARHKRV